MLNKEQILNVLRDNKPYMEKNLGVVKIGLFGSYAKDLQKADSDVDILVELDEAKWDKLCSVWEMLENDLQTKIDLIRKGDHLGERFLRTIEREIIYA
jgi:uncharacterized protein